MRARLQDKTKHSMYGKKHKARSSRLRLFLWSYDSKGIGRSYSPYSCEAAGGPQIILVFIKSTVSRYLNSQKCYDNRFYFKRVI